MPFFGPLLSVMSAFFRPFFGPVIRNSPGHFFGQKRPGELYFLQKIIRRAGSRASRPPVQQVSRATLPGACAGRLFDKRGSAAAAVPADQCPTLATLSAPGFF